MTALIADPARYTQSVFNGLKLFCVSVLPALFPFFFFTKLLTGFGVASSLGKICKKPVSFFYKAHPAGGYILAMSMMSGYPVGSKLLSELYASGTLDSTDVKKLSTFTSTSGPLFIVGTIGSGMLLSSAAGYLLLGTHYLAALINGLLYRNVASAAPTTKYSMASQKTIDDLLGESIYSAIISVLIVGGYIAIFNMVCDALIDVGFVSLLEKGIAPLLSFCSLPTEMARGIVLSFIEVTRGSLELSSCGAPLSAVLPFIGAFTAFGGLSIAFQSLTYLQKCKIKTSFYFLSKLTQAVLAFAVTYLFSILFF